MLVEALNPDQASRYDIWRRVKLKKEIVRKITNQTLSQSVPPSVITTINGYTKLFIGDLIDRARGIQTEWMVADALAKEAEEARKKAQEAVKREGQATRATQGTEGSGQQQHGQQETPNGHVANAGAEPGTAAPDGFAGTSAPTSSATVDPTHPSQQSTTTLHPPGSLHARLAELTQERDKGPLTPDMLREALRRYKRVREGGGTGFVGLSLEGRERAAVRMGGRRLFR